jgi:alpha-L-fucosidase
MKPRISLVAAILTASAALSSANVAGIDGKWAAEFDTQVGVQKYVFEFKAEGEKLTGKASWERVGEKGETDLKEGKIAADALTFVEPMSFQGNEVEIAYSGKLMGDELRLVRNVGDFATEDFVAKRVGVAPRTAAAAAIAPAQPLPDARVVAPGPFQPTWESLAKNYQCPEWFRDAKFGLWAHWSAQCVPEQGDWYARNMYLEGSRQYKYHVEHYGHPSKFGFMELDNLWKAEKWDPEKLMDLYVRAGAKYFVALANHHDNFDAYDSKYHAWNSVNVGPKKDIVGIWARVARAHGLRFGVTNHASHAWHWFQPAYDHDREGPFAGVPYDAATLTKADGKGTWWDGLDPQDLYCGLRLPVPASVTDTKSAIDWHWKIDGNWWEKIPPLDNRYADNWFFRAQDLVDKYQPDLFYFDDVEIPFEKTGLEFVAHYYNANIASHGGKLEAVMNTKHLEPAHKTAGVEDIERGVAIGILAEPWQTDTCIGGWHYDRRLFDEHKYKTVGQVVRMLVDIVSKNGNLLLNVPVKGDGTIDDDEVAFLVGMGKWMDVNGEAIYGTRPWLVYGEGPSVAESAETGQFGGARDVRSKPYTSEDVRFTTKGNALYAVLLDWPANKSAVVKTLATNSPRVAGRKVTGVALLGFTGDVAWKQDETGLHVQLPAVAPSENAVVLKIAGIMQR